MPIDFARVPPRVAVPEAPQPSRLRWAILLVMTMCLGAALAIALWPAGRPTDTVWFWLCVIVYPALAWAFLLCCRLAYSYARRSSAIAHNTVSEGEEENCHKLASEPLVVLGHGWCFSADDQENSVEGVVTGGVKMAPRASGATPGLNVTARWLEIPGKPFYPGNELTEYARHRVVCDWLLGRLVSCVSAGLTALPAGTAVSADLTLQSTLDLAYVRTRLEELLHGVAPALSFIVNASEDRLSLFQADAWHDNLKPHDAHLLIAIGLRKAVSEQLQDGAAETGAALLIARPGTARSAEMGTQMGASELWLHRPAIGSSDAAAKTIELAGRWGQAESERKKTVWNNVLSGEFLRTVKSSVQADEQMQWVDLETTVGDCAAAGPWLATALAAEHAKLTGDPQLVLTQEEGDMTALVCRRQT